MESYLNITRAEFMQFFRNDDKINELTADDRIEIFSSILLGSSDLTKELIDSVLSDYCITNLEVIHLKNEK